MNQKTGLLLLLFSICCAILGCIWPAETALPALAAQPFAWIGKGLRALSLLGGAGNLAAILLYAVLSRLPLLFAGVRYIKKKAGWEDWLLCLLSVQLFIGYYLLINPALLPLPQLPGMGEMLLGGGIYAVLMAYILIRFLRRFRDAEEKGILRYLSHLLHILAFVLIYSVFCPGLSRLLGNMQALKAGNTGTNDLGPSYAFLVLRYIVDMLPAALEIVVLHLSISLFRKMAEDRYAPETLLAARKLSLFCGQSLLITALAHAGLTLLQLIFSASLHQIDITLHFPLSDMALLLLALLLFRLLSEGKRLKEDNELFI